MTLLEPVRQSSLALVVLVPRNLVVPGPFWKIYENLEYAVHVCTRVYTSNDFIMTSCIVARADHV